MPAIGVSIMPSLTATRTLSAPTRMLPSTPLRWKVSSSSFQVHSAPSLAASLSAICCARSFATSLPSECSRVISTVATAIPLSMVVEKRLACRMSRRHATACPIIQEAAIPPQPQNRGRMAIQFAKADASMTDRSSSDRTTHFGFQTVSEAEKAGRVAEVFHSVASKYDLMNDLMSGGIHRLWKRFTIELSGVRPGNRVLDIAGGTGDLTRKFSRLVGPTGEVVLADINASMLKVGRDRLLDKGVAGNVRFVQADAEKLPFPDNHFDCIT